MLLHKDGLIELNYDVATDVLFMQWPDVSGLTMPEIDFSLKKLIDTLRHYDIKHLFVDSRDSKMVGLTNEEHLNFLKRFTEHLMTTRLQKMARLATSDIRRENIVDVAAEEAINSLGITFEFRNFSDEATAYNWLLES